MCTFDCVCVTPCLGLQPFLFWIRDLEEEEGSLPENTRRKEGNYRKKGKQTFLWQGTELPGQMILMWDYRNWKKAWNTKVAKRSVFLKKGYGWAAQSHRSLKISTIKQNMCQIWLHLLHVISYISLFVMSFFIGNGQH